MTVTVELMEPFGGLYSFEDAVNSATGNILNLQTSYTQDNGTLVLFKNGCYSSISNGANETSNKSQDCSRACQQGKEIWNDMSNSVYTLQNCMVYPIISRLMADGELDVNSTERAESMGISVNSTATVVPAISDCIEGFCHSDINQEACNPARKFMNRLNTSNFALPGAPSTTNLSLGFTSTICYDINGSINADLGGPGVFVAYIIQISVVILAWVALHLLTSWLKFPAWAVFSLRRTEDPWQAAREMQEKLASQPEEEHRTEDSEPKLRRLTKGENGYQRQTLIESLYDFQLTQVFFMISLQIAMIVAATKSKFYEARNYQALANDAGIILNLALDGCLTIAFTLLTIRAVTHETELFIVLSTLCCVFLAGAAWMCAEYILLDVTKAIQPDMFVESCGMRANPTEYCIQSIWWLDNASSKQRAIAMISYSWFVVLVLTAEHVKVFRHRPRHPADPRTEAVLHGADDEKRDRINIYQICARWLRGRKFWEKVDSFANARYPSRVLSALGLHHEDSTPSTVGASLIFVMELVLLALVCITLDDFTRVENKDGRRTNAISWWDWTLSSVISVTVWLPVFLKYAYYAIFGNHKHRRTKKNKKRAGKRSVGFKAVDDSDDSDDSS